MPEYSGYDLTLGGTSLKLVRNAAGIPQLQFLDAPDEDGQRGSVGQIVFTDMHHGLGPDRAGSPGGAGYVRMGAADTYTKAGASAGQGGWSAMRPGRVESISALTNLTGLTGTEATEYTGNNSYNFATAFQHNGDIYFVFPTNVYRIFSGGSGAEYVTFVGTLGTNKLRGPAAFYRGLWLIGLEDQNGASVGHLVFNTQANTWTLKTAGGDTKASLFYSVHGTLWAIQVDDVTSNTIGKSHWHLKHCDADDPTVEAGFVADTTNFVTPSPTAMHPLGQWLLVFGAEGEILAISEAPPPKALLPPGTFSDRDPEFGVGARLFGDELLVPGRRGLYAISTAGGGLRDVSPINVQPGLPGGKPLRPACIAQYGPDVLVGTRTPAAGGICNVLGLRRYPEGVFYHTLAEFSAIITGAHAVRAIESLPSGLTFILLGNATEGRIYSFYLPPPAGGAGQSPAGSRVFETSYAEGRTPGRKVALQVRGWLEAAVSSGNINILCDGAVTVMGSPTAQGPFAINGAHPIGRTFAISFSGSGGTWPVHLLPIEIDYMDEPVAGTRVQFDIESSGGLVRAGAQSQPRIDLFLLLKAFQGTVQTLAFLESPSASWSVVVEAVEAADSVPGSGRDRARSVIHLVCRRL